MEVKLFEIRDRGTFIPVMATRLIITGDVVQHDAEIYLLRRAGYAKEQILFRYAEPYVILTKLDGVEAQYDPFSWPNRRTMGTAHRHIIDLWSELRSGDVIDIEFILGETQTAKKSERLGETNIVRDFNPETERIIE